MLQIQSSGLTKGQEVYQKAMETKRSKIMPDGRTMLEHAYERQHAKLNEIQADGLTTAQRTTKLMNDKLDQTLVNGVRLRTIIARQMGERRRIRQADGLTKGQHATQKAIYTKLARVYPGGLNGLQYSARKSAKARSRVIDETGTTMAQAAARKGIETLRQQKIGDTTGLELRAIRAYAAQLRNMKGFRRSNYRKTGIVFQGSFERRFLESFEAVVGLDWMRANVKRGQTICYQDCTGKKRCYYPDFQIGNSVIEVKSSYHWGEVNPALADLNTRKLDAAVASGNRAFLVINQQIVLWNEDRESFLNTGWRNGKFVFRSKRTMTDLLESVKE
jgi:hypothetical protein